MISSSSVPHTHGQYQDSGLWYRTKPSTCILLRTGMITQTATAKSLPPMALTSVLRLIELSFIPLGESPLWDYAATVGQ